MQIPLRIFSSQIHPVKKGSHNLHSRIGYGNAISKAAKCKQLCEIPPLINWTSFPLILLGSESYPCYPDL